MSGIFVDQSDKVEVTLFYEKIGNKMTTLDEKKEGCKSITLTLQYPDFATNQQILRDSRITTESGQILDMLKLRSNMLYSLTIGWDAKDESGKEIPFSTNELNKLHPAIASSLINKIQEKVSESGFFVL